MAKKYMTQEEAARMLNVTVEQLAEMRMRQQVYGLKDGPNWKFKQEDIERVLRERNEKADEADQRAAEEQRLKDMEGDADSGEDVVLLSEFELGESGPSTSSTVIGKPVKGRDPGDSDIRLGGSDVNLGSDVKLGSEIKLGSDVALGSDVKLGDDDDLPIDLGGSDLRLLDDPTSTAKNLKGPGVSKPKASAPKKPVAPADDEETFALTDEPKASGSGKGSKKGDKKVDSALDLASDDDDELVLGGSGPGSDVTLRPGDSGISLLDPASDSGLSLDAPIELGGAGQELALGQEADFDSDSVMELKADDDFLLTPLEEGGDEDSSDSGSQVIALDPEAGFEDATSTMMAGQIPGMPAMLEEDTGVVQGFDAGAAGYAPSMAPTSAPVGAGAMMPAAYEMPFGAGTVVGLFFCVLLLSLSGIMMYDLVRNMWSWDQPYAVNSSLMDLLVPIFSGSK